MGMIANYQYINDEQLNFLKNSDSKEKDVLEEVEEMNEESEMLLDIDKMWDVLHFVLTGVSSCDPIENNPLSEAVVGVRPLEGQDGFIAYTERSGLRRYLRLWRLLTWSRLWQRSVWMRAKRLNFTPTSGSTTMKKRWPN